jgi:membrane protease YdiL (CAAX protease family)
LLILAIILSCLWVFATSFQGFRKELTMKAKPREHSALFETIGLLFATLFFSALVGLLANPPSDELPSADSVSELLFALANASVWEELIVRVLFIGLPLVLVDLIRTTKHHWHTYLLGGGFSLGIAEVVLIIVSSAIFGIGHYTGGWGAWKILPATVGGLAFGYLFLRFGIVASITMHFGTDYLSMPSEVTGSYPLTVVTGLGILVWLGAGSVFFGYYATRVTEFLTGKRYFDPRPIAYPQPYAYPVMYAPAPAQQHPAVSSSMTVLQAPMPPPYQATPRQPVQSWFTEGYVCPNCGSTQARWTGGRFQCLRCGRLS